ncbi:50S ribosomal protein L3 [Candidatus Woesearchaeota archaeon]|nr:MAG: 50S ribosomal protein L3 [Candidatus Woesearchaeota archaeon]
MAKRTAPRSGSMQVWPRKRARRPYARVRSWNRAEKGLLGFAGYKAGMTHVMAVDTGKNSPTKGETIAVPVTVLECPPLRIYSVRAYTEDAYGKHVKTEIVVGTDKFLARKLQTKKTRAEQLKELKPEEYADITIIVATQPSKTGIGKKKPELFEIALGGSNEEKLAWITEHVGKDIPVTEVFKEGDYLDTHAVTKGKGFQGPVKRFGIGFKSHKSEKGRRNPGSLGGWSGQQHFMYRIAHAGQTGYHLRTQYNNQILKVGEDPKEVNPAGGFLRYGEVKNPFVLVRGSVQGPKKRLVTLVKAVRPKEQRSLPTVELISTRSQQ